MGEHAELIGEGIFCCECGELIDVFPIGFPRQCEGCEKADE